MSNVAELFTARKTEIPSVEIPEYLVLAYEASIFPQHKLSLEEFIQYKWVVYKLAPTGRPHLSYHEWLEGFSWNEAGARYGR